VGHEVIVFTPHYKERQVQFQNFVIKSLVPWMSYGKGAWLPQLFFELRHFDIIHLHYPFFGGALPIYCLKKYKPQKTKIVLTYHMDVVGEGFLNKYFKWHTKRLMPGMIRAADRVIVTSQDYAENSNIAYLIKENPKKFIEIPLGTETEIFYPQPRDEELIKKYGIKPQEKTVLFVAALDREHYFKGLNSLLEAVAKIKTPIKLLVVGRGELKTNYEEQAQKLGIRDKVYFVGYISGPDLPKYYNLCDLFVMPSVDKSEAFGLVYVEAMACGRPVIATNLPGLRTVVDDNQTGYLVRPRDIDDLVIKMQKILSNDKLASDFGQNGFKKVQDKYTWPKIVKQIDLVYKSIKI
jgi:glycosyltransferase involved in cell wall biosynthesis